MLEAFVTELRRHQAVKMRATASWQISAPNFLRFCPVKKEIKTTQSEQQEGPIVVQSVSAHQVTVGPISSVSMVEQ